MASDKPRSVSRLPSLTTDKANINKITAVVKNSSPANSLPSLPSSPLVGDNRSLLSRASSKRSRLKSRLSVTSAALEEAIADERRTSSEPGGQHSRNPSVASRMENGDLERSISIGGKRLPTAGTLQSPLPSSPLGAAPQSRMSRPRSTSAFGRPAQGSPDGSIHSIRNSGSSSELASRKNGIYDGQLPGDESKRRSANSGGGVSGVSMSSPRWAGQLTHAVLELSQEINRIRGQGAVLNVPGQTPQAGSPTKPKSSSIFWSQGGALQNASSLKT